MKKFLFALAGLAIAASALAQLAKYKDWDKTPEAYFLTPEERAEWKKVSTDDDAEKFIGLYFARRGGEPFRDGMRRRIAAADEQFKGRRQKGSESARGRLFVVLGNPSRVLQSRAGGGTDGEATPDTGLTGSGVEGAAEGVATVQTWVYDKDKFDPSWGLGDLKLRVALDPQRGIDELQNSGAADKAIATIASKSIVNPNAAVGTPPSAGAPAAAVAPPSPATQPPPAPAPATGSAPATGAAPPAAAPPAPTMPLPASVKSALTGAAPNPGDASFWSGTFRSPSGDNFLALQYYLASNKPAFSSGAPLKFGGVVQDETGKEVESFWEDATFSEVAEAGRKDRVLDRSVALPPGSYKGVFGLFPAEGQPPVATSTVDFKLEPKSDEFAVSPLILSAGLVPLTKRPGPNDPFVFGTEKPIKVEPKGDKTFSKQDSLWYFYTVSNPGQPADAAAACAGSGHHSGSGHHAGGGRAGRGSRGGGQAARDDPHQRSEGRQGRLRALHRARRAAADRHPLLRHRDRDSAGLLRARLLHVCHRGARPERPARVGGQQGNRAQRGLRGAHAGRFDAAQRRGKGPGRRRSEAHAQEAVGTAPRVETDGGLAAARLMTSSQAAAA